MPTSPSLPTLPPTTEARERVRPKKSHTRIFVSLFAIVAILAMVASGAAVFFSFKAAGTVEQLQALEARIAAEETSSASQDETIQELRTKLAASEEQVKTQEELLAQREGFVTIVAEAAAVLEDARGKVDVLPLESAISSAQERVAAERLSPAVVQEAGAAVVAAKDGVSGALAAHNEEQARQRLQAEEEARRSTTPPVTDNRDTAPQRSGSGTNNAPRNTSGNNSGGSAGNSGGGSAPAQPPAVPGSHMPGPRAALDAVGGGWVALYSEDVVCNWAEAVACSYYDGKIIIANKYAGESKEWWLGYMAHEYAHQIQYKQWNRITTGGAPGFDRLFGRDIEWLADCMAQVKVPGFVSGYGYSCTQEQLDYSSAAWSENFA
jgi:hypothetical protein